MSDEDEEEEDLSRYDEIKLDKIGKDIKWLFIC